jgi:REP element-mobilizing transposase RayT
VFIPKCRRKTLYQELRRHLGEVFRKLAVQKEAKVGEGHLMPDHAHMLLSIPPKYAVSQVVGFIKGKSAIHLARVYGRLSSGGRLVPRPSVIATAIDQRDSEPELDNPRSWPARKEAE